MQFIGVKETNVLKSKMEMNEICYEKVMEAINKGHQAMVFVHSRKDTGNTARNLAEIAKSKGTFGKSLLCRYLEMNSTLLDQLLADQSTSAYERARREIGKSRNREVKELFDLGFGIHHAGMLRQDRNLMEKLFSEGIIKAIKIFILAS
jgi:activating signal cointegrator complex subunit 3